MALADEIARLRDTTLESLDASHNYYAHTKEAWRLVQLMVRKGQKFAIRNQVTGASVDETGLSRLAPTYVKDYLLSATFQHFVSLFEQFVFGLLRAWLVGYPHSLSRHQLQFRTVLEAEDKSEIVAAVVEQELLGLAYKRLADWFSHLERIAGLGLPAPDQVERLAEIKASRDVLVHSNGIANRVYIQKSMGRARFGDGDALELPEHYHRESWQLMRQVVSEIADAAIEKLRG